MKIATFLAVAIAIVTSIPLLAQEAGARAQENTRTSSGGTQISDSANAGASANARPASVSADDSASEAISGTAAAGTRGSIGYGDEAASHAFEMTSVTGELEGKLDSKTAKPGERVVVKTTEKVQTADGTMISKGSHLIGHVTEVQPFSKEHGAAQLGIAFDRAELKNGQSVEIYTLLRGVSPAASVNAVNSMDNDDMMSAPMGGGGSMGAGSAMGGGRGGGGVLGGTGGALNRAGGLAGGTVDRAGNTTGGLDSQEPAAIGSKTDAGAVETAGHGDPGLDTGAHAAAAARAVPRPTRVPGLMLAGSSSASGLLLASRKNIELDSGTQMQLGIVAK